MNNSEVRKHLRKGEQAVTLLESLGYRYNCDDVTRPSSWITPAPKKVEVDPSVKRNADFLGELQGLLQKHEMVGHVPKLPADVQIPDVEPGDLFYIVSVPKGHFFDGHNWRGHQWTVTDLSYISKGSEASAKLKDFVGWAVGYNYQAWNAAEPRKLWLPLSCIRVSRKHGGQRTHADF